MDRAEDEDDDVAAEGMIVGRIETVEKAPTMPMPEQPAAIARADRATAAEGEATIIFACYFVVLVFMECCDE